MCSCRTGFSLASDGRNCQGKTILLDRRITDSYTIILPINYQTPWMLFLSERLTVSIAVDYTRPADFNGGPNEYRAASGPVTVTCTATGAGSGTISYQWSSNCRNCPFQSATSSSITRAAVHSGDTGTHTCVATRGGATASASIDIRVVGESSQY